VFIFFLNKANLMQVPASITLTNGNTPQHHHSRMANSYFDNSTFPMEVPEKLTGIILIL
jgi:hypothetical protein